MKTITYFIAVALLLGIASKSAWAQSSGAASATIGYQGVLSDAGVPARDGDYTLHLSLYSDTEGLTAAWQGTYTVHVTGGVFNVAMGSGEYPLPSAQKLDGPLYLGVRVGEGSEIRPLSTVGTTFSAQNVADGAITQKKMGTDYVQSLSLNGQKVSARGADINIQTGDGITASIDPTTNTLYLKGSGTGSAGSGKGATPQGSTGVAGTQNEVLANGTYGTIQSGNVTLTTAQAIGTTSSPTFSNLTLSGKATSAATVSGDASTTLTTKGYVDNAVTGLSIGSYELHSNVTGDARDAISATAPLSYSIETGSISITQANGTTNGYLSSTDWNTFNNKQPAGSYATTTALSTETTRAEGAEGTLTTNLANETTRAEAAEASKVSSVGATAPLQSSGGTTPIISMHVADASDNGYLSSTDWNKFNNAVNGLGTMANQNSNNVAITGGSISGTAITGVYYASSGATATVPATAFMVEIADPGASHIVAITLPAVVNGREIHIHNNALAPTSGDIVVPPGAMFTIMGTGGAWVLEKN